MTFPNLLPNLVTALEDQNDWIHFFKGISKYGQVTPEARKEGTEAVINKLALSSEAEVAYIAGILAELSYPYLVFNESYMVDQIAQIANEPAFNEKYDELQRIPTPEEFMPFVQEELPPAPATPAFTFPVVATEQFPQLLPNLVDALKDQDDWWHFFTLVGVASLESRKKGIEAIVNKMGLSNLAEITYVASILEKVNFHYLMADEACFVDEVAKIANEPAFNEKYDELQRIPTAAEFLPSTPPIMPPAVEAPLLRKRKSDAGMDAATTTATQFFLESQSRVLKRVHSTAATAAEVFNFGDDRNASVIAFEPFKLEKKSLAKALNARIGATVAINQLLDSVPAQHVWSLLKKAHAFIAQSLVVRSTIDERRINHYFYFFNATASRLADPQQKFEVLYNGLELLVNKIQPDALEEFVAKRLNSLLENEREIFIDQARFRAHGSNDLAEAVQAYITHYDAIQADQRVSFTP